MNKLLSIIFIATISCQYPSDLQKQLNEQCTLLDYETKQIVNEIQVMEIVTPKKYGLFKTYSNEVIDKTAELISSIMEDDKVEEQTLSSINKYFDFISQEGFNEDIQSTIDLHHDLLRNTYIKGKRLNEETKEIIKLQLKGLQNNILNNMLSFSLKNSFTFSKVYPVVIENKKELKRGEEYKARIVLAAINKYHSPKIEVEGHEVNLNSNLEGEIQLKTDKIGRYDWRGKYTWLNENTGDIIIYEIDGQYEVK